MDDVGCEVSGSKFVEHELLERGKGFFYLPGRRIAVGRKVAYRAELVGRDAEALEWHDGCMGDDPTPEELYTAACLYARMNKPFEAINSLLSSLNMGFRALDYLEHDDDLASLRNLDEYKEALEMYRALKAYEDAHFLLDDEIPEPDQD